MNGLLDDEKMVGDLMVLYIFSPVYLKLTESRRTELSYYEQLENKEGEDGYIPISHASTHQPMVHLFKIQNAVAGGRLRGAGFF